MSDNVPTRFLSLPYHRRFSIVLCVMPTYLLHGEIFRLLEQNESSVSSSSTLMTLSSTSIVRRR